MTRERAKELLPVIQAFAEGREIQSRKYDYVAWSNCPDPAFWPDYQYRIKPSPRAGYVPHIYDTEPEAQRFTTCGKPIRVQEVL